MGEEEKPPPVPVEMPLPHDVCVEIAEHVHEDEALAFASSCKGFRDAMKESLRGRKTTVFTGKRRKLILTTRVKHYKEDYVVPVSDDWIKWAFSMKWEYAEERGYPYPNEEKKGGLLTFLAACGGYKDVLVWLKSQGCSLGIDACCGAAQRGHIKVLKYLKREEVPFNSYTCREAAEGGQLSVLQWLRSEEVNCPWDIQECLHFANRYKHREVI